jgi:hypothetical protein
MTVPSKQKEFDTGSLSVVFMYLGPSVFSGKLAILLDNCIKIIDVRVYEHTRK